MTKEELELFQELVMLNEIDFEYSCLENGWSEKESKEKAKEIVKKYQNVLDKYMVEK